MYSWTSPASHCLSFSTRTPRGIVAGRHHLDPQKRFPLQSCSINSNDNGSNGRRGQINIITRIYECRNDVAERDRSPPLFFFITLPPFAPCGFLSKPLDTINWWRSAVFICDKSIFSISLFPASYKNSSGVRPGMKVTFNLS